MNTFCLRSITNMMADFVVRNYYIRSTFHLGKIWTNAAKLKNSKLILYWSFNGKWMIIIVLQMYAYKEELDAVQNIMYV